MRYYIRVNEPKASFRLLILPILFLIFFRFITIFQLVPTFIIFMIIMQEYILKQNLDFVILENNKPLMYFPSKYVSISFMNLIQKQQYDSKNNIEFEKWKDEITLLNIGFTHVNNIHNNITNIINNNGVWLLYHNNWIWKGKGKPNDYPKYLDMFITQQSGSVSSSDSDLNTDSESDFEIDSSDNEIIDQIIKINRSNSNFITHLYYECLQIIKKIFHKYRYYISISIIAIFLYRI